MKLVIQDDPILKKVCEPFDFENPFMDPNELIEGLQAIRKTDRGVGLAAPQVGLDTRVLVIGIGGVSDAEDFERAFFNPTILAENKIKIYMLEGCLSYPGLFVKIKRAEDILLRWNDIEGEEHSAEFKGITSRILQHEVDHLNGITFIHRANKYHLNKAQKDLKMNSRYKKRNEKNNYIE
jgi:peptide deformylase